MLAAALILHLLTSTRHRWLERRSLRALGLISFSLYLWHYPILRRGIPWALRFEPVPDVVWKPMVIVGFVALSVAVAVLSYLVVERPFAAKKPSSKASAPERRPGARPSNRRGHAEPRR